MMSRPEYRPITATQVIEYWDDLTVEEAEWIDGDAMRLIEALQTKFGISEDEAAMQVSIFLDRTESPDQKRG